MHQVGQGHQAARPAHPRLTPGARRPTGRSWARSAATLVAAALLAACSAGHGTARSVSPIRATHPGAPPGGTAPGGTAPGGTAPGGTAPGGTAPATTTTVDPGTLPQTDALPPADDPAFVGGIEGLFQAVVTGDPASAMPVFFPETAYRQVKATWDPDHDWQTRLVAHYDTDIAALHAQLGADAAGARFQSVSVPEAAAEWITPGVEYNKGSYWRVYGTEVHYTAGGTERVFPVDSLISWRGEWYVVHLSSFA